MEVIHCDDPEAFDALVMDVRGQLVLVEFWGHDCPNCELYEAVEPELLRELGDVSMRFVKVNAYKADVLGTRFAIYGIPTFMLVRDGVVLGRMTSFKGKAYWLGVIRDHLTT